MGTRNLTMVTLNEDLKVAQYCQWNGYPTGVGNDIVKFILNKNMDVFKEKLNGVSFISEDELEKKFKDNNLKTGWVSIEESEESKSIFPEYHRDTGPNILNLIYEDKATELENSHEFIEDGLFCEWAYNIDLDNNVLEVYRSGDNIWKSIPFDELDVDTMKKLEEDNEEY